MTEQCYDCKAFKSRDELSTFMNWEIAQRLENQGAFATASRDNLGSIIVSVVFERSKRPSDQQQIGTYDDGETRRAPSWVASEGTGRADIADLLEIAHMFGAAATLRKPFDMGAFMKTVADLLSEGASDQA